MSATDDGERTIGSAPPTIPGRSRPVRLRRRSAVWAAAGATLLSLGSPLAVPAAHAVTTAPLTGTFVEDIHPTNVQVVGGFTIITVDNTGVFTGSLNGTSRESGTVVVYPDGSAVVVSQGVCQCTFGGRSGPVRFVVRATISPVGRVTGQVAFTGQPGGLLGLAGGGLFEGFGNSVELRGQLALP